MSILLLFLIYLWNQPSIRILGFGREFTSYVSDPVNDILRNPAFIKNFEDTDKINLNVFMQNFDCIDSIVVPERNLQLKFFETIEPLSLIGINSQIGILTRLGAWSRYDCFRGANWLYGRLVSLGQ